MAAEEAEIDLDAALSAEREVSPQVLSVYIPNRNRRGRPINARPWIREAQAILGRIGEGYTTTPPLGGRWETESGAVRRERTVIVYTYVKPDRFLRHLAELRRFLHRFGREADQEVVVVELSGGQAAWFFRIMEYDE